MMRKTAWGAFTHDDPSPVGSDTISNKQGLARRFSLPSSQTRRRCRFAAACGFFGARRRFVVGLLFGAALVFGAARLFGAALFFRAALFFVPALFGAALVFAPRAGRTSSGTGLLARRGQDSLPVAGPKAARWLNVKPPKESAKTFGWRSS